jgi:hypothetical protein
MEILLILGMTIFFFLAYAVIAILYPEWVGITGKRAKEIEAEQRASEDTTKIDPNALQ